MVFLICDVRFVYLVVFFRAACVFLAAIFRGAACLDFFLKPKGTHATYVWEHLAHNPRVGRLDRVFFVSS